MGQVHTTHVANAYTEDIWVSVRADVSYLVEKETTHKTKGVKEVDINTSGGEKTKFDWKFATKNGFTKIPPKGYVGFQPASSTKSVHITILSSSGSIICVAHPKHVDYSVIVTKQGYLVSTQYGKIWVDTSNKNHLDS
jgi:hypothetical protein